MKALLEVTLGGRLDLPAPQPRGGMSVEEAIARRRSVREFSPRALTLEQISHLLWAAQGMTSPEGLRAAPSAGARYPLELYLVSAQGLFQYHPEGHALTKLRGDDLRRELAQAALGQSFVAEAPVSLVFAAVHQRTTRRYGDRGLRYVHIDVGHAAQNVHLQAVALGLASVPVGAFDDSQVARALHLPADQAPIYIVPVGYARA